MIKNTLDKLTIVNFFCDNGESVDLDPQIEKLDEEIVETIAALRNFYRFPTLENMIKLNNEIRDQLNVADGLLLKLGGNIQEQESISEGQIHRTTEIIGKIPKETKFEDRVAEYDKIRKGY